MKKNSELKFEDALKRLEEITATLESGGAGLEEMLKLYQEGMELLQFCEKKLEEAQQKISILIKKGEGEFVAQKFAETETAVKDEEVTDKESPEESSGGLF